MAAFQPTTLQHELTGQDRRGTEIATASPALQIPCGERALRQGEARLIEARHRSKNPRLDEKTLAGFVRSMRSRKIIDDSEVHANLASSPALGLFSLADLSLARIEGRTELAVPFRRDDIHARLEDTPLSRPSIAALAHAGSRVGLYDATTLKNAIAAMDILDSQFMPFWWSAVNKATSVADESGSVALDFVHSELHSHDAGVYVSLSAGEPLVGIITVPGDASPDSTLVRDTLLALIESLMFSTHGLTPRDCLQSAYGFHDDAQQCREWMGGGFTRDELLAYLEIAADVSIADNPDDANDAIVDMLCDFGSLYFDADLGGWADIMAVLADDRHWLNSNGPGMPHPTANSRQDQRENAQALHRYALVMVESLRNHLGDQYPETVAAAETTLSVIEASNAEPISERSPWDNEAGDMEGVPLDMFLRAWVNVRGGEDSHTINRIFGDVLHEVANDDFNSGVEYVEGFMLSRDPATDGDSSAEMMSFLSNVNRCFYCLDLLESATDNEVKE